MRTIDEKSLESRDSGVMLGAVAFNGRMEGKAMLTLVALLVALTLALAHNRKLSARIVAGERFRAPIMSAHTRRRYATRVLSPETRGNICREAIIAGSHSATQSSARLIGTDSDARFIGTDA